MILDDYYVFQAYLFIFSNKKALFHCFD